MWAFRSRGTRWLRGRFWAVPLLGALFVAALAQARVGNGEHYQNNNPNNPNGDSNDDSGILFQLIWFAFRYPKVGVPVLVIGVLLYWWWHRNGADGPTRRAIERADELRKTQTSADQVEAWVNALKARDPAFELLALLDKAKHVFLGTQAAWLKLDLNPVRPFLSDATFQRLTTQLFLLQSQGVRDAIADLAVLELQLIGLEQSDGFDTVQIRVRATCRDTDVPKEFSLEQAEAAARKQPASDFVEVWSFVRKPGVASKPGATLENGLCPNCGAPFTGGATNRCDHCGAVVNSGNHDWVLAEITQGSEFQPADSGVPGLAQARQTDPALNTEVLDDRASLAFWRWVEAESGADLKVLNRIGTPGLLDRLKPELTAMQAQPERRVFLECAVGGVNTLSVSRSGDQQIAQIDVRWSVRAVFAKVGADGRPLPVEASVRRSALVTPQHSVITLTRAATATSNPTNGMATSRCPNCSAPEGDPAEVTCPFCGTALNDGGRDWVFDQIQTFEQFQAAGVAPAPGNRTHAIVDRQERERLLYMMAALAKSDGEVAPQELQLLKMSAERWGIAWSQVELALSTDVEKLFARLLASKATPEAEQFLEQLVRIAKADGRIDRRERKMLELAAGHLGITDRLRGLIA